MLVLGDHRAIFQSDHCGHLLLGEMAAPSQIAKAVWVLLLEHAGFPFYLLVVIAIYQVVELGKDVKT